MKQRILTSGDRALGLGDGFILAPTLVDLSKKYIVHHIASNSSYNILKHFESDSLKIFNMDTQGHFYHNDHIESYDLVYWEVKNRLRNLGKSAVNVVRELGKLPPCNSPLPDIPIAKDVEDNIIKFMSKLKGPIVVTQPLMSYYNKMITDDKQVAIVDALIKKKYTVIQLTGNGLPKNYLHPDAIDFVGKTNLPQSLSIIKHADVFLGCDSFGQHASATLKTPSVVMWCGTSPLDFGYPFHSNIFHPDIVTCQNTKCGRCQRRLSSAMMIE